MNEGDNLLKSDSYHTGPSYTDTWMHSTHEVPPRVSQYTQNPPRSSAPQRVEFGKYYATRNDEGKIVHNVPQNSFMRGFCLFYLFLVWTFFLPASIPNCILSSCISAKDAGIDLHNTNDICPNLLVARSEIMPSHVHNCYITDASGCPTNGCPSIIAAVFYMFSRHLIYGLVLLSVLHLLYTVFTVEKKDEYRRSSNTSQSLPV